MRVFAIDWSGAKVNAKRKIWLAEVADGAVRRLENGRDRDEIAEHLIREARLDPHFIVGLDFAFSLPLWFLEKLNLSSAPDLWALAARDADTWLQACLPPFWGHSGTKKPTDVQLYRKAELLVPPTAGISPKSVFQIAGAGAVGTGSLRGMAVLHQLHLAGFAVWPFTTFAWPGAIEIYPRLLTGPVNKSNPERRAEYLMGHFPEVPDTFQAKARASEDAFDALISALILDRCRDELAVLPAVDDPQIQREGLIWQPGWGSALTAEGDSEDRIVEPPRAEGRG